MKKVISLFLILIIFQSCRLVKKSFLEENYTSKNQTEQLKTTFSNQLENTKQKVIETTKTEIDNSIEKAIVNTTENKTKQSNTSTNIEATLEAEEGKTKSFKANGLEVTSNGANVKIKSSSKTSESESKLKAQQKEIQSLKIYKLQSEIKITELEKQIISNNEEITNLQNQIDSQLNQKEKYVTLKDMPFTFWLIVAGVLLVSFFLSKIKNPFKKKS